MSACSHVLMFYAFFLVLNWIDFDVNIYKTRDDLEATRSHVQWQWAGRVCNCLWSTSYTDAAWIPEISGVRYCILYQIIVLNKIKNGYCIFVFVVREVFFMQVCLWVCSWYPISTTKSVVIVAAVVIISCLCAWLCVNEKYWSVLKFIGVSDRSCL